MGQVLDMCCKSNKGKTYDNNERVIPQKKKRSHAGEVIPDDFFDYQSKQSLFENVSKDEND